MITLNEKVLFFSAVYDTKLDLDNQLILDQIKNLPANSQTAPRRDDSGFQTPNLFDEYLFKDLFSNVKPFVNAISDKWGINKELDLVNCWVHVNKKYDYGMSHVHPEGLISGIYYVKVPSNSGNIVFERPDNQELFFEGDIVNPYNYKFFSHVPVEGMLILFPSWLKHKVQQNITEDAGDERISIAFNYR